ncbi:MAG TPA: ABC transporter substrate-binding protein, partial [Acidimicrobiales bacterium]|nr:ABC transporter substrate-binding protein [Acidimicrobiales bacterium]
MSRLRAGALAASLVLSTLALAGGSSGATLTTVTYAYDFPGPDFELIPVVVAQEKGYFAAQGLKVNVVFPPNTSTTSKMLATGSADIGFVTTSDMGVALNAGVPMTSIGNFSMSNNWALFAKPGVSLNAAGLHASLLGKRIFSYGDTWTEAMLPYVLRFAHLAQSQVTIVTDPSGNDLTSLLAGKVDFATNTTNYEGPNFAGTHRPGHLSELLGTAAGAPNIPIWVYATSHSFASHHAALVTKFMTAVRNATRWAVANPAAAAGVFDMAYPKSGYSDSYNKLGWSLTLPFLANSAHQYFVQTSSEW